MTFVENIARYMPNVPEWFAQLFEQTGMAQVTIYYNIILWVGIMIAAYIIAGFQRRYAQVAMQSFALWWVHYQPRQHGLITLNIEENPMFANGFLNFITQEGNFILVVMTILGVMILVNMIRYILMAFFIAPLRYKMAHHEGSTYDKMQQRRQNKAVRKQARQQRAPKQKQPPIREEPVEKKPKDPKIDNNIESYM